MGVWGRAAPNLFFVPKIPLPPPQKKDCAWMIFGGQSFEDDGNDVNAAAFILNVDLVRFFCCTSVISSVDKMASETDARTDRKSVVCNAMLQLTYYV